MTKSTLVLSAALILGTLSGAAANSWDPVPGDRNPGASFHRGLDSRNLHDVRMQVGRDAPTVYIDRSTNYMDRASQTVDGGW